jgi:hypothetical protein
MKIVITSTVLRDGKLLEIGEPIDIPKKEAQALIDAGAAEISTAKAKTFPVPSEIGDEGAGGDNPGGAGGAGDGQENPPADA